ncbi:conjugal transfer protein TraF, partial [Shigella boydii]|uniref:conjugal transfer protein TraF n=1 Tax=Shigella boydii TaxID=621 RepID=UPI00358DBEDA
MGFPPNSSASTCSTTTCWSEIMTAAFKGDRYHNTKNGINADIGASTNLDDNWTLGLVAQNL